MRLTQIWSLMAVVLAFGGVGLASQTAKAICCNAPLCQREEPPSVCNNCVECPGVEAEQMSAVREMVYDEVEGVCYETGDVEAVPCAEAEVGPAN